MASADAAAPASEGAAGGRSWLPIESNPEVMTTYAGRIGWPTERYSFYDLLSTDDWALEMIPRPVIAALMLYPIKAPAEEHRAAEAERIARDGQVVAPSLYFSKQTIPNACGTVGILHAVANTSTLTGGWVDLREDSFLSKFIASTLEKTPGERAEELEKDDEIDAEHGDVVVQGQSAVVDDTWNHFIAFVEKEGHLYELDGRKETPINHGPTSQATLLEDAVRVMKEFMARDEGELRFTMVALAPTTDDAGASEDAAAAAGEDAAAAPPVEPAAAPAAEQQQQV